MSFQALRLTAYIRQLAENIPHTKQREYFLRQSGIIDRVRSFRRLFSTTHDVCNLQCTEYAVYVPQLVSRSTSLTQVGTASISPVGLPKDIEERAVRLLRDLLDRWHLQLRQSGQRFNAFDPDLFIHSSPRVSAPTSPPSTAAPESPASPFPFPELLLDNYRRVHPTLATLRRTIHRLHAAENQRLARRSPPPPPPAAR